MSGSGTTQYFPPEKHEETKACISTKSDVYSLGLVFAELLLGEEQDKSDLVKLKSKLRAELKKKPNNEQIIFEFWISRIGMMISQKKSDRPTTFQILQEAKDKGIISETEIQQMKKNLKQSSMEGFLDR